MVDTGLSGRTDSLVTRCRRLVTEADRGWKATALGIAVVLAVSLVL